MKAALGIREQLIEPAIRTGYEPRFPSEPTVHEVVNVGKQLEVISMDLSGTPTEILREVSSIARAIQPLAAEASPDQMAYQV